MGVFFLIVGLLMLAFGILGPRLLKVNRGFTTLMAIVKEQEPEEVDGSYHATVEFQGRRARVRTGESTFYVGEAIGIYYDPKEPEAVYHGNRFSIALARSLLRASAIGGAALTAISWWKLMK